MHCPPSSSYCHIGGITFDLATSPSAVGRRTAEMFCKCVAVSINHAFLGLADVASMLKLEGDEEEHSKVSP